MKALSRRFSNAANRHPWVPVLVFAVVVVAFWALFVPQDPPDMGITIHARGNT